MPAAGGGTASAEPDWNNMAALPEKFGKYGILDVAGRGNMGIVYVGYDPFADRHVAVKVCAMEDENGASSSSRLARKLFFNEAHTAGMLDHPNILHVFDAGEEDGEPYIIMEYIENATTLSTHCAVDNLLPISRVSEVIYQCAKALDYAHRRGVIHRDIKPTNIMLDQNGNAKIGDFGIAQGAQAETTQIMGVLGSPRYMSPEQAREDEVTNQTDLYSLGVVAYELLTGQPPFSGQGFSRLMYKILNEAHPALRQLRPDVPESLERIVDHALRKNQNERYKMGREICADLANAFAELAGHPDTTPDRDQKFASVRQLRFFNDLADAEVWEVLRASVWESYAAGDRIIIEGNVDDSFYVIVHGDVGVCKGDTEISALGTGDCFGEMGYLSKTKRTASILAKDDVSLLKINSSLIEQASTACQLRFNKVFIQTLIERLTRTSEQLSH